MKRHDGSGEVGIDFRFFLYFTAVTKASKLVRCIVSGYSRNFLGMMRTEGTFCSEFDEAFVMPPPAGAGIEAGRGTGGPL